MSTHADGINNYNLHIVAGDIKSFYSDISRSLVEENFTICSHQLLAFHSGSCQYLVNLTMLSFAMSLCSTNKILHSKTGIITGGNHSVSLANVIRHYIILPISGILNQSIQFKRLIDDTW